MMKINLKHTAKLANLEIKKHEEKKFEKQLEEILGYFEKLKKINIKGVEVTSQVKGLENLTRKDVSLPSLSQEDALSNTKSKHNGLFKVKAIFNE